MAATRSFFNALDEIESNNLENNVNEINAVMEKHANAAAKRIITGLDIDIVPNEEEIEFMSKINKNASSQTIVTRIMDRFPNKSSSFLSVMKNKGVDEALGTTDIGRLLIFLGGGVSGALYIAILFAIHNLAGVEKAIKKERDLKIKDHNVDL